MSRNLVVEKEGKCTRLQPHIVCLPPAGHEQRHEAAGEGHRAEDGMEACRHLHPLPPLRPPVLPCAVPRRGRRRCRLGGRARLRGMVHLCVDPQHEHQVEPRSVPHLP